MAGNPEELVVNWTNDPSRYRSDVRPHLSISLDHMVHEAVQTSDISEDIKETVLSIVHPWQVSAAVLTTVRLWPFSDPKHTGQLSVLVTGGQPRGHTWCLGGGWSFSVSVEKMEVHVLLLLLKLLVVSVSPHCLSSLKPKCAL